MKKDDHLDYFTLTYEEAASIKSGELIRRMGEITGQYSWKHYVVREVTDDRVGIFCSKDSRRGGGFARFDDWMEGALEEFGAESDDPADYPMILHDNEFFLHAMMHIVVRNSRFWTWNPEYAGRSPIDEGDEPFYTWLESAPLCYDDDAAVTFLTTHLIIRPPEGDEETGQVVALIPNE